MDTAKVLWEGEACTRDRRLRAIWSTVVCKILWSVLIKFSQPWTMFLPCEGFVSAAAWRACGHCKLRILWKRSDRVKWSAS